MPNLTLKNVPDHLYEALKYQAAQHYRSLNNEAIHCLERVLLPQTISSHERLAKIRALRATIKTTPLSPEEIQAAIDVGRS